MKRKERKEPGWVMKHLEKTLMYESGEDMNQKEYLNVNE